MSIFISQTVLPALATLRMKGVKFLWGSAEEVELHEVKAVIMHGWLFQGIYTQTDETTV